MKNLELLELKGRANVRTAGVIWSLSERYKERTIPVILLALFTDTLILLTLLQKVDIIRPTLKAKVEQYQPETAKIHLFLP